VSDWHLVVFEATAVRAVRPGSSALTGARA